MHKTLKMRVMSLLLAVVMVVSGMPTSAFAAYTEVAPGYNATTQVLSLHANAGEEASATMTRDDFVNYFGYANTDRFRILQNGTEVWDSLKNLTNSEFQVADGTEYLTQKNKGVFGNNWIDTATFTVKVYDTLTITTTKDGETTPETVNLYRGDSYDINK